MVSQKVKELPLPRRERVGVRVNRMAFQTVIPLPARGEEEGLFTGSSFLRFERFERARSSLAIERFSERFVLAVFI